MQTTNMRTVMIADDAPFMRNMLRSILEMGGCTVVAEAADGAEAVAAYLELRPALTFMDIAMPGKSGVEAAAEIISHDGGARIVLCGLAGQESKVMAGWVGAAREILFKPYRFDEVLEVVRRVAPR